jgi:hypothetical protein
MSDNKRATKRMRTGSASASEYVETNSVSKDSDESCRTNLEFLIDIVCVDETEKAFIEQFGGGIVDPLLEEPGDQYEGEFNDLIKNVVLEKLYEREEGSAQTDETAETAETAETIEYDPNEDGDEYVMSRFPRIGDRVSVSYIPASQKYIEHYAEQAFTGEVFFVDPERNNFFMYTVDVGPLRKRELELTYRVQSYKREGCHFFGMADCYDGMYEFV